MRYPLRQYGAFAAGSRGKLLNLRAPDDALAYEDDGPPIARSPSVGRWIEAYFAADTVDDDNGRETALKGIIASNRADHDAAGLPVYAHHPLPEDFAEALRQGADQAPVKRLLAKSEPSVRPQIAKQFAAQASLRSDPDPAVRADQRSAFASRIEHHPQGLPTPYASEVSGALQPFQLLGGNDEDEGGAPDAPRMPHREPRSPATGAKPGAGPADCDAIRKEHADIRRAIAHYEQRRETAERQLSDLVQQRNRLQNEQREVSAALAEARSRATDPPMFLQVCRSNPKKESPAEKPGGNEVGCELVGPIISDEAEKFWKRRLEEQKERDIARLEAELRRFPDRFSRLDKAIGAAQAAVADAKDGLHYLYLGLSREESKYESQCGKPRELWPY